MKKTVTILAVITIFLSGCSSDFINEKSSVYENQYVFDDDYEYTIDIEGFDLLNVPIENDTSTEFSRDNLNIFYDKSIYIPYLELENYLNLMKDAFDEELIITYDSDSETWKMFFDYEDGEEYVLFDFLNNKIELSSVAIIDSAFKVGDDAEELIEILEDYYEDADDEIIEDSSKVILDLSKYGIEMMNVDETHLIPMHVLFFVFSAYDADFYYNGETAFYTDIFNNDLIYNIIQDSKTRMLTDLETEYANSFTELVFENFYGLKDIKGDYLKSLENLENSSNYYDSYVDYLKSFEEDHTSLVAFTHGVSALDVFKYFDFDLEVDNKVGCSSISNSSVSGKKLDEKTALIEVNSLSDATFANDYFEELEKYRDYENIVIDLKCNRGGYVANAPILIYPFTDESVDIGAISLDGAKFKMPYIKTENRGIKTISDANLFLVTSNITFSAANLATSLFDDYDIGTIIGESSGGGTAAIAIVSVPNGAIISMSFGSLVLTDNEFNIIEDGIKPDIEFEIDASSFEDDILEIVYD